MTSKIVLGTVQFGINYGINNPHGKPDFESVCKILSKANSLGIDELDTADAYGTSTEVIAACLAENKSLKFKVMSKFIDDQKKSFAEYFEGSLAKLGLPSLEGYYFHRFDDFLKFNDFEMVKTLKREKKLKNLCVSLYSDVELEKAIDSDNVDVIQLPFNVLDCSEKKMTLLQRAKASNKKIYARSIFLQGLFFKDINTLPVKLTPLSGPLKKLQELARDNNLSIEELCLNFVNQQDVIEKIVIGVDSSEQLERNCRSIDKKLSKEVMDNILAIKVASPELLNPANWN